MLTPIDLASALEEQLLTMSSRPLQNALTAGVDDPSACSCMAYSTSPGNFTLITSSHECTRSAKMM